MRDAEAFTKCGSMYHLDQCTAQGRKKKLERFANQPSTHQALHIGKIRFQVTNYDVYDLTKGDIMKSELENLDFLLEKYRVRKTNIMPSKSV